MAGLVPATHVLAIEKKGVDAGQARAWSRGNDSAWTARSAFSTMICWR